MVLKVNVDLRYVCSSAAGTGSPLRPDLGFRVPQYPIAILHAVSGRIISNFGSVPVPGTGPP